jgi:hypothetical protein
VVRETAILVCSNRSDKTDDPVSRRPRDLNAPLRLRRSCASSRGRANSSSNHFLVGAEGIEPSLEAV